MTLRRCTRWRLRWWTRGTRHGRRRLVQAQSTLPTLPELGGKDDTVSTPTTPQPTLGQDNPHHLALFSDSDEIRVSGQREQRPEGAQPGSGSGPSQSHRVRRRKPSIPRRTGGEKRQTVSRRNCWIELGNSFLAAHDPSRPRHYFVFCALFLSLF